MILCILNEKMSTVCTYYYLLHFSQYDTWYVLICRIIWSTHAVVTLYIFGKQQQKQIVQSKPKVISESFYQQILRFVAKQRSTLLGNATSSSSPLILVILPTFPFSSGRFTTAVSFTVCPTSQPRWGAWPTPNKTWFAGSKTTFPKRLAAWWPTSSQVWDGSTSEKRN